MSLESADARADTPRRRGRPRDARVDAAVIEATLDLILEGGVANLSMDQVAQRAGVGKATIYRRWDNKEAMLLDAIRSVSQPLSADDTGSLRGDLEAYFGQLIERYGPRRYSDVLPHLVEASFYDDALRVEFENYMRQRQAPMRAILERAAERGELGRFSSSTGINTLVAVFLGPSTYRNMLTHEEVDEQFIQRFLDIVLPIDASDDGTS